MVALDRTFTQSVWSTASLLADMPQVTGQECKDTIVGVLQWPVEDLKESARKGTNWWQRADIPKSIPLGFFQVIEDDMPNVLSHLFLFLKCVLNG